MARWIFHRKNGNINLLMPFLTYSIEPELAENFDQTNAKNIEKFLTYIDLLNNKKRAILVDKNNKIYQKNILIQLEKYPQLMSIYLVKKYRAW